MIAENEPGPFEQIDGADDSRLIIVCDHAHNRFPAALGRLGISEAEALDHIAWDIGAAGVAERLRARFAGDAVLANYSRLVIDLNRAISDRSSIPAISDGVLIPGNLGLDDAARAERAAALHAPYHAGIERLIERRSQNGRLPVFIGVHSFTPRFHGTRRPWHVGILWDRDPRLALPLLQGLRRHSGIVVGDNEPYSGRHTADYSIDTHAEVRGMAHAGIEIRQDLIADEAGQEHWAGLIGDVLERALADESLFEPLSAVNPMS